MLLTPEILVPSCKLLLKYDVYIDVIKCIAKCILSNIFFIWRHSYLILVLRHFSAVRNDQDSIYCSNVSETIESIVLLFRRQ